MSTRPPLSPLLKWSGGKRSEIPLLKPSYPTNTTRVIEPFSGGAAVSLELNTNQIVLNDVSSGLIDFYSTLQTPSLRTAFKAAVDIVDRVRKDISKTVNALNKTQIDDIFANIKTTQALNKNIQSWVECFPNGFHTKMQKDFVSNLHSKIAVRVPNLEKKHSVVFTFEQRKEHLETALQSGLYTTLRRIYNAEIPATKDWSTAAWYVVRSVCYSGMFRYGKNGAFNVPYGGIAYNSRDFASSLKHLMSSDVTDFLSRSEINQLDFEDLFAKYNNFNANDFIFVDPPYDSAFSQYNADGDFTANDQKRLANVLLGTSAKWMLVIKNTPFILSLYQDPSLFRGVFGKNYQVNFRNRHDRGVEHLVVTNYPLGNNPHIHLLP